MSTRVVKKLILHRNGDPTFKPVSFTYNNKQTKSFENFLEECETRVGTTKGDGVRNLYTTDGRKVISLHELEAIENNRVVVAGKESFKEVRNGYDTIGKAKPIKARSKSKERRSPRRERTSLGRPPATRQPRTADTSRSPRPRTPTIHDEPDEEMKMKEQSWADKNKKTYNEHSRHRDVKSDWTRIHLLRANDPDFKPVKYMWRRRVSRTWEALLKDISTVVTPYEGGEAKGLFTQEGKELKSFDELESQQAYVVVGVDGFTDLRTSLKTREGGRNRDRKPTANKRPARSLRNQPHIMNRRDQVKPVSLTIYVFLNGKGFKGQRFTWSEKQIDKGMPWIIEQISKSFVAYGTKLTTLDGEVVRSVNNLEKSGAYVLLTHSERKFRDCWYFLPDGFLDTGYEARMEREEAAKQGEEPPDQDHDRERDTYRGRSRDERTPETRGGSRRRSQSPDDGHGYGTYERDTIATNRGRDTRNGRRASHDSRTESEQGRRHDRYSDEDDLDPYPDDEPEEPGKYVRAQTRYGDRYYEEDLHDRDDYHYDDEEEYLNSLDDDRDDRNRRSETRGRNSDQDRHTRSDHGRSSDRRGNSGDKETRGRPDSNPTRDTRDGGRRPDSNPRDTRGGSRRRDSSPRERDSRDGGRHNQTRGSHRDDRRDSNGGGNEIARTPPKRIDHTMSPRPRTSGNNRYR